MNNLSSMIMLFFLFSIALLPLPLTQAADQPPQLKEAPTDLATVTLTGRVTEIHENRYVIKDTYGIKWEFQVDKSTNQIGQVIPGVMVTAEVETNGHAKKVKILEKG